MKNTFLGSMVAAALLAVFAVGCAPLQQTTGNDSGYYEPDARVSSVPTRVYVEDPYFPGRQILMERDPYTGRYYPVAGAAYPSAAYGGVYSTPAPYDPYYNRSRYRDPYYSRPRNGGGYRNTQPAQSPRQRDELRQQQELRRQDDQRRSNAADDILRRKQ